MSAANKPIVIVTGGNKRVGKTTALTLARAGFDIFITYHSDSESATATLEELHSYSQHSRAFPLNQAKTESLDAFLASIEPHKANLAGLVNNAAIFYPTEIGETTFSEFDEMIHTNLRGPFFLAERIGKMMQTNKHGQIINIADAAIDQVWPEFTAYFMAKSGVITMTKGLAKAFAPHVLVNAIAPGTVLLADEYDEVLENSLVEKTPLKRVGRPEDIAAMTRFLLTENRFSTGSVFTVDGGRRLH
jgi:NAD(P)-dependent dehydrogenase (short-subunit alcohol dehydrogenase family)